MKKAILLVIIISMFPTQVFSDEIISDKDLKKRMDQFFNVVDRACYFKMKETASFGKNDIGYFRWNNGQGSSNPVIKKKYSKVFVNQDMYLVKVAYSGLEQKMESWQETESYCYFDLKDMEAMKTVVR